MWKQIAASVLVAVGVGACAQQIGDHWAVNRTDDTIVISEFVDGRESTVAKLGPGSRNPLLNFRSGECSATLLVAKSLAGREIARRSETFCPGDEWVITDGQSGDGSEQPTAS